MKKAVLLLVVFFTGLSAFAATKQQVVLNLQDVNAGYFDQTTVYFDSGLVNKYTSPQDAELNLDSSNTAPPLIYSFTSDDVACSVNGYGSFTASTRVNMGVDMNPNDTYLISIVQMSNFDPTTMIILEDQLMHAFTDLRKTGYTFQSGPGGTVNDRFVLHFSFPPQIASVDAGCSNEQGSISVTEDSSITWTSCALLDSGMNQVGEYQNVTGNFNFGSLPAGTYTVQFLYGTDAPAKPAAVVGNKIIPVIEPSSTQARVGQDITFTSLAQNATIFNWNFGDGSTSNVADPEYTYSQPGTYTITLQCNNSFGCVASTSAQVTIGGASGIEPLSAETVKIFSNGKQVEVKLDAGNTNSYSYELYNILGERLQSAPISSTDFTLSLAPYSPGIYIFNVKGVNSHFAKKIMVTE
jgi:plastocyanin